MSGAAKCQFGLHQHSRRTRCGLPNTLQHRLSPFELKDKSKPGHRKFIVMFLVDPNVRITSTAEVSPQQLEERRVEAAIHGDRDGIEGKPRLPGEISKEILSTYRDESERQFQRCKQGSASKIQAKEAAMTYEEACWHRARLMDQRRHFNEEMTTAAEDLYMWSLCEH